MRCMRGNVCAYVLLAMQASFVGFFPGGNLMAIGRGGDGTRGSSGTPYAIA